MPRKNPPTNTDADISLLTMAKLFANEDEAREWLEKKRWPEGPVCPKCGSKECYALTAKPGSKSGVRPGVKKCKKCRAQFTVRVGTIFEDSKLPIRIWLMAIQIMCASKKGVSSHQLARQLEITQKSSWFVCHRIREAMKLEPMAGMLSGHVEVDETWVGARKPRHPGTRKNLKPRCEKKTPVLALVERDGKAVAYPIISPDSPTLKGAVRTLVDKSSTIHTDALRIYRGLDKEFDGGHKVVNHTNKEYVRYEECGKVLCTTNTVESFFGVLKRAHIGTFHHLSEKHLHRYTSEFAFRWNTRKGSDGERMVAAVKGAEGKRLMYREPK